MTYFDLTNAQKDFYIEHKAAGRIKSLLSFLQYLERSKDIVPDLSTYEASLMGADGPETGQNGHETEKVAAPIKPGVKGLNEANKKHSHYKDIICDYDCPINYQDMLFLCRKAGFSRWKKAAASLLTKGCYVKARNFSEGGGYDLYEFSKFRYVYLRNTKVHPRHIEKTILKLIKNRN